MSKSSSIGGSELTDAFKEKTPSPIYLKELRKVERRLRTDRGIMVIEVVSPASQKTDKEIKLIYYSKYEVKDYLSAYPQEGKLISNWKKRFNVKPLWVLNPF